MSKLDQMVDDDNFAVQIHRNGSCLVTLGSNFVVSRDLTAEDVRCIRNAARRLIAFIEPHNRPGEP